MASTKHSNSIVGLELSGDRCRIAAFTTGTPNDSHRLRCDEIVIPGVESYSPAGLPAASSLVPLFKNSLARLGVGGGQAAVALGAPHMVLRHAAGLEDEVRTELEQTIERSLSYVQFGLGERVVGEHLQEVGDGRVHGLLGVSAATTIVPLVESLEGAGLRVTVIEPALVALTRLASMAAEFASGAALVVWAEPAGIDAALVRDGQVLFTRHVPSVAPIDPEDREPEKVGPGSPSGIILELGKMSRHYARTFSTPDEVRDVIVCGTEDRSSSLLAELDECADFRAAALCVSDSVSTPLRLPSEDLVGNELNAVAIGAGAGLILDAARVVGPNLASRPKERNAPRFDALIRALFIPTLVAAGLWGLAAGAQQYLNNRVNELQIQVNHPSPVQAKYRELQMELNQTEQRAARIAELAEGFQGQQWNDVLETIRICVPERLWLTRIRTMPEGQLNLAGAAFDESLAYEFVKNIEGSPLVESATIITQTSSRQDRIVVNEFSVECIMVLNSRLSDTTDS